MQVAEQQGKYLARGLNKAAASLEPPEPQPFVYKHMGSMAFVGEGPQHAFVGEGPVRARYSGLLESMCTAC